MAVTGVFILTGAWFAGVRETSAQPAKKKTTAKTVAAVSAPLPRVEQRRTFIDLQERRRLEIVNQLEFSPRPFPKPFPKPPFPFPHLCLLPLPTPASAIDPHRSLFVHDRATLDASGPGFTANFSLRRTLDQIASQVTPIVPGTTTALTIFTQLWDTQNAAPGVTSGPHCTDNGSTINGFPIQCPRNEGQEAMGGPGAVDPRIDDYKVLALVNRLDLAHQGWRNCGEHRIVYGKSGPGKNLIIFEAVLPNPRPGCREGCLPVAQFWASLSSITDPVARAQKLDTFFYTGLPGFRPVVHVNHYSANGVSSSYGSSGSGQIRTNQFLQTGSFQPWLLKEFKTVIDCGTSPCTFNIVPVMVKVNPFGTLWNEDNPDPRAVDFRADTAAQLVRLSNGSLTGIGYEVDQANDAGQSMEMFGPGFVDNYRDQMNSAAAVAFRAALGTGSLTADQIANRALTQSCAGCHQPGTFGISVPGSIGTVTTPVGSVVPTIDRWPNSAGFVHVDVMPASVRPELSGNPAFGTGQGQVISEALLDFFLPERKNFLLGQLNSLRCTCRNRFGFLTAAQQRTALAIEDRIESQFHDRVEALEQKILELEATNAPEPQRSAPLQERSRLLAERDRALAAELARNGIKLRDAELLDLKAQPMRLRAGRDSSERVEEVNRILRQEPPRRTVTGSFRPH